MRLLSVRRRRLQPLTFRLAREGEAYVDHLGREHRADAGRRAFNAYRGGRIVGSVSYLPPQPYVPEPQLETVWVAPEERGGPILLVLWRHMFSLGGPFPLKSHMDDPRLLALYARTRARAA